MSFAKASEENIQDMVATKDSKIYQSGKTQLEYVILSVSEGNNTHGLSPFVREWLVNSAGIGDVVGL
jgi:hypothetical protein